MKIVRIQTDEIYYGVVEQEGIGLYEGSPFVAWEPTEAVVPFSRAQLLAPVLPTKIVAVARNYAELAAESGAEARQRTRILMRPATTVVGPGASVVYPQDTRELHHEAELAVIMGRIAHNVAAEDAFDYILGYTAANDMTARDIQRLDGMYTIAKGFDTFCPLGPWIVTADEVPDPGALSIRTVLNGEVMQDSTTRDMIFPVEELISFLSQSTTLFPGTVILTGTPPGVGFARTPPVFLKPGDQVSVEIEGIGTLANPVRAP